MSCHDSGTGTEFVLNEVTVAIVSDEQCSARDWYGSDFLPVQTFCAGYRQGGKDACEVSSVVTSSILLKLGLLDMISIATYRYYYYYDIDIIATKI